MIVTRDYRLFIAGSDYVASTERVNFPSSPGGVSVQCALLQFFDDSEPEPNEIFFADLSDPQGGCSITTPSTSITIFGKNPIPLLAIATLIIARALLLV